MCVGVAYSARAATVASRRRALPEAVTHIRSAARAITGAPTRRWRCVVEVADGCVRNPGRRSITLDEDDREEGRIVARRTEGYG